MVTVLRMNRRDQLQRVRATVMCTQRLLCYHIQQAVFLQSDGIAGRQTSALHLSNQQAQGFQRTEHANTEAENHDAVSIDSPAVKAEQEQTTSGAEMHARAHQNVQIPHGRLVAQLSEHNSAVTSLSSLDGNHAFVSTSYDGQVKLWDLRALAVDGLFQSSCELRPPGGRVLASCALQGTETVALGSSKGRIELQSVQRYAASGGTLFTSEPNDARRSVHLHHGSILQMHEQGGLLMCATESANLCAYDPRAGKVVMRVQCDPRDGVLTSIAGMQKDTSWLISGTSGGRLALWDLRFMVAVNAWCIPTQRPVQCLALSRSGNSSSLKYTPYVWAAAGREEVALWNAIDGSCKQVLRKDDSDPHHNLRGRLRPESLESPKDNEGTGFSALGILQSAEEMPPGPRAILPLAGSDNEGALLISGLDACTLVTASVET